MRARSLAARYRSGTADRTAAEASSTKHPTARVGSSTRWQQPLVQRVPDFSGVTPFHGAAVLTLTDPTTTATAIAPAAKDVLRRARD
jgi:hypothetical protein